MSRASEMRRREFAWGRACAANALGALGIRNFELLSNPDRSPAWPTHVVGSLTHTNGYCAAAVALTQTARAIGIDAEQAGRVTPDLWRHILTDRERATLPPDPLEAIRQATTLFSAKEAYFKAQFPHTGLFLDFPDADVVFTSQGFRLTRRVSGPAWLAEATGRIAVSSDIVVTAIMIPYSVTSGDG